jgi:hypothetical protein
VAGRARRRAHARLAEQLGVVRDEREVERPAELHAPRRLPARVVGLDADRRALRERVRVARRAARALAPAVEGERGVDVQVAEERLPQRVVMRARRPLLGAREAEAEERGSGQR